MSPQYEMRKPTTEAEAVSILKSSVLVLFEQIQFERGERTRAWNGAFVDHVHKEAVHAMEWLAERHPLPVRDEQSGV